VLASREAALAPLGLGTSHRDAARPSKEAIQLGVRTRSSFAARFPDRDLIQHSSIGIAEMHFRRPASCGKRCSASFQGGEPVTISVAIPAALAHLAIDWHLIKVPTAALGRAANGL
jgi:hypothetical protein